MNENDREKLAELSKKIENVKQKEEIINPKDGENSFIAGSKIGIKIGLELFSNVLVGGCIGRFLDVCFDKTPLFLIIFLFLGCISGLLNVYRFAKSREEENK